MILSLLGLLEIQYYHTDHLFSLPRNFAGEVTLCYVGEKKKVPEMDRVISTSPI